MSHSTMICTENDNDGPELSSKIGWLAPADGTYYVRVLPESGSATGCDASYELGVTSSASGRVFLPIILKN